MKHTKWIALALTIGMLGFVVIVYIGNKSPWVSVYKDSAISIEFDRSSFTKDFEGHYLVPLRLRYSNIISGAHPPFNVLMADFIVTCDPDTIIPHQITAVLVEGSKAVPLADFRGEHAARAFPNKGSLGTIMKLAQRIGCENKTP